MTLLEVSIQMADLIENDQTTLEDAVEAILDAAKEENDAAEIPLDYVDAEGNQAYIAWRDLLVDAVLACAVGDYAKMLDVPTGWQVTAKTLVFTFELDALVTAVDSYDK